MLKRPRKRPGNSYGWNVIRQISSCSVNAQGQVAGLPVRFADIAGARWSAWGFAKPLPAIVKNGLWDYAGARNSGQAEFESRVLVHRVVTTVERQRTDRPPLAVGDLVGLDHA